ncbi:hypothetical protein D3C72_1204430 [compost metagenome]
MVARVAGRHPRLLLPQDLRDPPAGLARRARHDRRQRPVRQSAGQPPRRSRQPVQLAAKHYLPVRLLRRHRHLWPEPVQGCGRHQCRQRPEHPPQHAAGEHPGNRQRPRPGWPGRRLRPAAGTPAQQWGDLRRTQGWRRPERHRRHLALDLERPDDHWRYAAVRFGNPAWRAVLQQPAQAR